MYFFYKEEEVIILRKKALILKDLIKYNSNYTSQLVTSSKVKIAGMIELNKNIFSALLFC